MTTDILYKDFYIRRYYNLARSHTANARLFVQGVLSDEEINEIDEIIALDVLENEIRASLPVSISEMKLDLDLRD